MDIFLGKCDIGVGTLTALHFDGSTSKRILFMGYTVQYGNWDGCLFPYLYWRLCISYSQQIDIDKLH
jgi:hypothetical protein